MSTKLVPAQLERDHNPGARVGKGAPQQDGFTAAATTPRHTTKRLRRRERPPFLTRTERARGGGGGGEFPGRSILAFSKRETVQPSPYARRSYAVVVGRHILFCRALTTTPSCRHACIARLFVCLRPAETDRNGDKCPGKTLISLSPLELGSRCKTRAGGFAFCAPHTFFFFTLTGPKLIRDGRSRLSV